MLRVLEKVGSRLRRDAGVGLERTYLYRRESTEPPPQPVEAEVALVIEPVSAADLGLLCSLGVDGRDEWEQRIERGDQCYGAWIGSELVHYSWVQTRGAHTIAAAGLDMPFRPGELWIYNCRTSAARRGLKIYPRTLQYVMATEFARGATTAWIYTAEHNVASQRGVQRAGFVHVLTLRALRLGRRYQALATRCVRDVR